MRDADRHGAALGQVLELTVLLSDDMDRALVRMGLTTARTRLLWELHHRGPSTQRDLAEALEVTPRNVTGLVDALVDTGFVTRQAHPTDRRATLVDVTERGARTARDLVTGRAQLAELLFSDMPDRQFDGLVDGLGALLTRLREELASAEGQQR
jgi:DNA-binding MarR family transcriptional regulator